MPRPAPRKTNRQAGNPSRRRQVAGSRARRPAGSTEAVADDSESIATTADAGIDAGAPKSTATATTTPRPRPSPRPAPSPEAEAAARGPKRRVPVGVPVLALTAAAVVLAILVGVMGWFSWQQARTDDARTAALAASRSHAQRILSYDYRKIDDDIVAARKATTGSFRDEYTKTTSTVVKPTATKYKAVVTAEVRAASVRSATPDEVIVVLFVNQTTTSTRITGPKVDQSRVRMTLVKVGNSWLVSGIDAL